MNLSLHSLKNAAAISALALAAHSVHGQASWRMDSRGALGPIAQVALPDLKGKSRTSFVAFEYDRKCDPLFSFAEITGTRLGKPVSQSVLAGTKIGIVVNGKFHTGHAAIAKYDNGYEAGVGVSNELFHVLVGKVESLAFITPDGERVPMPTEGFRQSVKAAFDTCAKRFK